MKKLAAVGDAQADVEGGAVVRRVGRGKWAMGCSTRALTSRKPSRRATQTTALIGPQPAPGRQQCVQLFKGGVHSQTRVSWSLVTVSARRAIQTQRRVQARRDTVAGKRRFPAGHESRQHLARMPGRCVPTANAVVAKEQAVCPQCVKDGCPLV